MMFYVLKQVKSFDPKLIHNCPYTNMIVRNFTVQENLLPDFVPTGQYKNIFHASDEKNNTISVGIVIASVTSSDKNSWG